MSISRIVSFVALALAVLACADPGPVDEAGATTDPGDGETGDGDGDSETGDGDGETGDGDGEGDGDGDGDGDAEPFCGDGVIDPLELCDDGNRVDGDGCQADCTLPSCTLDWYGVDPEVTISGSSFGGAPIAVREDGTFASAHEGNGDPGIDIRLRSWTPDGELSWELAHSFDAMRDRAYAMTADSAGDLYLAASINATTDSRANVVKLSGVDGSVIWQYVRDGMSGDGIDRAVRLQLDSDGRLIVAMEIADDESGSDVIVTAFDPSDGAELWTASWSGPPGTNGLSSDFVAGLVVEPGPADDVIYVAANRSAGPLWLEPVLLRFEPPATDPSLVVDLPTDDDPDYDTAEGLVLMGDGELVAALSLEAEEQFDVVLLGLSKSTGEVTWQRPAADYGLGVGDGEAHVAGLLTMPDGGLALTGWGNGITQAYLQGYLLILDADLEVRCLGLLDNTVQEQLNGGPLLLDAAASGANRIYAAGLTFSGQYRTMVSAWNLP